MSARLQRMLPFLLGACMVLAIAGLTLKVRYELQIERESAHVRTLLETVRDQLSAELNRAANALYAEAPLAAERPARPGGNTTAPWQPWRLGAGSPYVGADGSVPAIAERTLRHALEGHRTADGSILILGPFATDAGDNALVIARAVQSAGGVLQWRGATALMPAIIPPTASEMMRQGYRVQWRDPLAHTAFYQSDLGTLDSPVAADFRFSSNHLQLLAAPRAGWRLPLRWWSASLLLPLGVLLWLSYELRRGRRLREASEDLEEAEARRRQLNIHYGQAIENVAALESRLQVVSMYDTVTGLANRSSLLRRIESVLDGMRQSRSGTLGLLSIGFDHVHHITNSFGAQFASRVLVVAAERVEFVLPSKDLLYRIGDFHLAVVLPHLEAGGCERLAEKIIHEIESPIAMDSHTFMLHPSVGIAETASGYQYAEALLDQANSALGAVERDATRRYCVFDSSVAKEAVSRLQLEVDLSRAFEEHQFELEYEPIVVPVTTTVAGFEALLRWNHPTEGRLSPGKFVPIAIQAGMSHRLNDWVMREAARQAALWRKAGHRNLFINFNLSAEAFLRPNLHEEIGAVLAEFELPGECLSVELTESALIQDLRGAARTLQRLGELGIRAWLDDFGTGYSSLSYLRALPLKGVKIDRSFVERTTIDARDFGFLKSLIDLISYLGMQSIAEGIETREQCELLQMTTCDLYQGYHFCHSMPAPQAERWMLERNGLTREERRA